MDYINFGITFLLILIIFAFAYLPKRKEDKKLKQMQDNLKEGDRVITYSGLSGKITQIEESGRVIVLLYPSNIEIGIEKWAIAGIEESNDENS